MATTSLDAISHAARNGNVPTSHGRRRIARPTTEDQVVVASFSSSAADNESNSSAPFTSLALSPSGQHAVAATSDTLHLLQISATSGLTCLHTLSCAALFVTNTSSTTSTGGAKANKAAKTNALNSNTPSSSATTAGQPPNNSLWQGWRSAASTAAVAPHSVVAVVITDVSWSFNGTDAIKSTKKELKNNERDALDFGTNTWVAAGGSNGVILLWSAASLRGAAKPAKPTTKRASSSKKGGSATTPTSTQAPPPVAILRQHHRAVNRIHWHPTESGVFLSASQDGTVRLWEQPSSSSAQSRQQQSSSSSSSSQQQQVPPKNLLGQLFGPAPGNRQRASSSSVAASAASYAASAATKWTCTATFEPKAEAVRDVAWHPLWPDVWACVTAAGTLVVYHRRVRIRSLVKRTAAHGREASCVQWHPRVPHIIATGGASDGTVKVWNLGQALYEHGVMGAPNASNATVASITPGTTATTNASGGGNPLMLQQTNSSSVNSRTEFSETSSEGRAASPLWWNTRTATSAASATSTSHRTTSAGGGAISGSASTSRPIYVLTVAASVTRVQWRPPCGDSHGGPELGDDRHDAHLAVSTAPLGWMSASGGAAGSVGLWSCHRPYMALSVVEGHTEGSVIDFVWLETPTPGTHKSSSTTAKTNMTNASNTVPPAISSGMRNHLHHHSTSSVPATTSTEITNFRSLSSRNHVEDGGGLDNSEHSRVGLESSVQGGDIWQHVLSVGKDGRCLVQSLMRGKRPLARVPPSVFAMANLSPFQRGYGSLQLFTINQPIPSGPQHDYFLTGLRRDAVTAEAPGMFRETPSEDELAAANERSTGSSNWWAGRRLPPKDPALSFHVLDQGDLDDNNLPQINQPSAVMVAPEVVHMSRFAASYLLRPTPDYPSRASLCHHNSQVADQLHCEQVAHMWETLAAMLEGSGVDGLEEDGTTGMRNNVMQFLIFPTVQTMMEELAEQGDVQTCVAICEVLEILNADGTTKIQELDINLVREWYLSYIDMLRDMCLFSYATEIIQRCADPYIADSNKTSTTIQESCPHCRKPLQDADANGDGVSSGRRACKNCRRRIGMCFLCHQPVTGIYVWCPGCGHGGHLDHALSWFGGLSGKAVRELW